MFDEFYEIGIIKVVQEGYNRIFIFDNKKFCSQKDVEDYITEGMYQSYIMLFGPGAQGE